MNRLRIPIPALASLTAAALLLCACNKPEAPPPAPVAAPQKVNIESTADAAAPPAPAPPEPPVASADIPAEAPTKEAIDDLDPAAKLFREELAQINRGLKAFIAKHQRLPKDFAELAVSLENVPGPPPGKYWMIDGASQTVKLANRK